MKSLTLCLLFFLSANFLKAQPAIWDTLNFENNLHESRLYFDSTQSSGIWQIGKPQKTLFDSAYSGELALLTDTLLNYSSSSSDTFYLGFSIYGNGTSIEFKHRYDMDSLHAFGNIELSADSGQTWKLLHDSINPFYLWSQQNNNMGYYGTEVYNLYTKHDLSGDKNGFTGKSTGWVTTMIMFPCYAIKRPWEVYLRFNFSADSMALASEGWIIDDILINSFGGECSNLGENKVVPIIEIYPNPNQGNELKLGKIWEQEIKFKLYNLTGQLAQDGIIQAYQNSIPLRGLQNGFYSLRFYEGEQLLGVAKLQKQ
tara:strand:+ start:11828 stop:12766 length:939 start_codon:yes stop_codon:yes gene_type:complete